MSGLTVPLGKLWGMKLYSSIRDTQALSESKAPSVKQEGRVPRLTGAQN